MNIHETPLPASLVSKWFILTASVAGAHDLDNMKLQKLLFLAQGRHLATFGDPLLRERIEAWKHGPVVSTVYHEYKVFGDHPIAQELSTNGPWSRLPGRVNETLQATWNSFAVLSAWRLRDLTHDVGPWETFFRASERHVEIPNEAICAAWPLFAAQSAAHEKPSASARLEQLRSRARATPLRARTITPEFLLHEVETTEESRREASFLIG